MLRRLYKAARRLWLFATCDHRNCCRAISFADSTELRWCLHCGRLLEFSDEGSRRHNPHWQYPLLDYTAAERAELLRLYDDDGLPRKAVAP